MSGETPRTYREPESVEPFVGDPLVGIPVARGIVREVARKYDLRMGMLARALSDVERSANSVNVETLFAHPDTLPVGADGEGHLFIVAEADTCWDVAADEVGLTEVGQQAVAEAHHRHVLNNVTDPNFEAKIGFVVVSFDFPPGAVSDVLRLYERTTLTGRQATVEGLARHDFAVDGIAQTLGIAEPVVKAESAAIEKKIRRAATERQTLDTPAGPLSTLESEPTASGWMGLDWSPWYDLRDRNHLLKMLPEQPGLYRVRHRDISGLLYIGETGAEGGLRDRVGHGLAVGMNAPHRPIGGNHDATEPLWDVAESSGVAPEVSVATPPIAASKRHRRSIEAVLVAVCRRETGKTPDVMLNRKPVKRELYGDTPIASAFPADRSYEAPSWQQWRAVTSSSWLGFDWTLSRSLSERTSVDVTGTCVFRVWKADDEEADEWERSLTQVGTTGTIRTRLFKFMNEYGPEARFSVAELQSLSSDDVARSRELEEVRYDLVGAHYLATGHPPKDQY